MKGGMEKVAYELYKHLSEITDVELVKWGGSNKWLPIILPYFFLKSCWILLTKKIDIIYLQDGLLAPLGSILKKISGKKAVITIHGLDVTYKNKFYQFLIPKCISKMDKVICISHATKQECTKRGITEEKITIVPDGISDEFYLSEDKNELRSKLENKFKVSLINKKILLSVGRLVERKGFHWFSESVIPILLEKRNDFVYLIVGDGIYREKIKEIITKNNLEDHVFMLGKVDDETIKLLYNSADIFIMPNIQVEGDMEGFGIVALEAASCGVPVVASRLEGIKDAIKNEKNGFLVEAYNVDGFCDLILKLIEVEEKIFGDVRSFVLENYKWEVISKKYFKLFLILTRRYNEKYRK